MRGRTIIRHTATARAMLAIALGAAALGSTGCQLKEDPAGSPALRTLRGFGVRPQGSAGPGDTRDTIIEQLRLAMAEKDSALGQVRATQDFIDEIDRQLTAIPGASAVGLDDGSAEVEAQRRIEDVISEKIARARAMLEATDAKVREREARIRLLLGEAETRDGELRASRESVSNLMALVERQRTELARQADRLAEVLERNRELEGQVSTLADSIDVLRGRANTVYLAIGTRDELLERGVIVKEGGSKIGPWRTGQTLQPARNPPRSAFRVLDLTRDVMIPLPYHDASYAIVSKHDPRYLEGVGEGGVVRGALRVRDPGAFWEGSRYLILVRPEARYRNEPGWTRIARNYRQGLGVGVPLGWAIVADGSSVR